MATKVERHQLGRPTSQHRDFVEGFIRNVQALEGKIDSDADGNIMKTAQNTTRILRALQKAVMDTGFISMGIFLAAACKTEPLPDDKA